MSRANACAIGVVDEENHSRICSSCFIQLDKHAYRCEVVTATRTANGDLRDYQLSHDGDAIVVSVLE